MPFRYPRLTVLVLALLLAGSTATFALVNPRGSDDTIDIATWNLRQFPQEGQTTVSLCGLMVGDLEFDIIGVQEITDVDAFETVASNAGGWGAIAQTGGANLKQGVWYKTSKVQITGSAYSILDSDFTRDPFVVPVAVTENDVTVEFNFCVLHLKAYDTPEDIQTRMTEMAALKDYIDAEIVAGNDRWVVVGDYNDELEDDEDENIFTAFLDDTDYTFITEEISGIGFFGTYIFGGYFIDHIMATAAVYADYGDDGDVETCRLDDEYDSYTDYISDHRPVAAYFPAVDVAVDDAPVRETLPAEMTLSVWPVPSNASVTVSYEMPATGGDLTVYDVLGREVWTQSLSGQRGTAVWAPDVAASGVYLVRLSGLDGRVELKRAVLVR